MKYFLLILLISTIIIGDVIGETRHEALKRMIRNAPSARSGGPPPGIAYKCFYQCIYRPPPTPPPPGPIWAKK